MSGNRQSLVGYHGIKHHMADISVFSRIVSHVQILARWLFYNMNGFMAYKTDLIRMDHAYERILAVYMFQIGHFKYNYYSDTIQDTIKIYLQWYTAIIIPLESSTSIVFPFCVNESRCSLQDSPPDVSAATIAVINKGIRLQATAIYTQILLFYGAQCVHIYVWRILPQQLFAK